MIRPYSPGDLAAVLEIWLEASLHAHPFLDRAFLERERAAIADTHLPKAETWVWQEAGGVAGFIALLGDEVGGLFVRPELHGRGIGRALMNHARSRRETLELSVFEANSGARAFYEACGFEEVGRRIHQPSGQPELRLRLEPSR